MKVIQRQQQQRRRSRILPSILRYGFAVALGMTLQTLFLSSSSFDSVQQQQEMAAAATTAVVSNDFFTTTTTRPSGTADASTRTINPTTREEDSTTTFDCQSYLLEILQRQDCFRQRMSQEGVLRNNGNNNNTDCCQSGRGTKTTTSTNMRILPFHNYAGYHGQGFGRIVEHTVLSCLFATMILQRPCTLDFDSCRDIYWTWRSFINVNTFNWDWNILSTKQKHDIIHTLQTNLPLPIEKSDEWPNNNNNNILNNSQVLPLKWNNNNNNNKTLEDHLNEWKAGTSNNNKILVSPNWGNDWYRHVPLSNLINEATHGQCKFNKFRTVLQNSMYAPTSLSKTLHQERIHRLLVPTLLQKKKDQQQPQQQDQPPQQQQKENEYKYGAIHLRSILSDASIRMDYSISHPEIVNALSQCLLKATKTTKKFNEISVWWIIGDNRTIAEHMKQSLQERHHSSSSFNSSSWQFVLEDDDNFWNALMHSGHAMKQRYHQEQMASSMMDFMVLHESTIAIVSHGAFGSTGARGNGKVKVQSCAPHQMFSIYSTSY
eukprot:scaffold2663_cov73-Cylindrotheca_fusiformis.AAC.2